jgi:hypothetical protein
MKVSFINQMPRYRRVSENEEMELWRYSPYNLEYSMGISVLHTILCGVSILVMFDWRSNFELRPNLSSVRFRGLGNFIPAGNLVHYCTWRDSAVEGAKSLVRAWEENQSDVGPISHWQHYPGSNEWHGQCRVKSMKSAHSSGGSTSIRSDQTSNRTTRGMFASQECRQTRVALFVRVTISAEKLYSSARNSGHVWNSRALKKSGIRKDLPVTRNRNANRTAIKEKLLLITHQESRSLSILRNYPVNLSRIQLFWFLTTDDISISDQWKLEIIRGFHDGDCLTDII